MAFMLKRMRTTNANLQRRDDAAESQVLTESLYKQNLELAIKNKIFTLLRQLYQVSLQELKPIALTQMIVTLVRDALNFELVSIYLFDESHDSLTPIATAQSERFKDSVEHLGNPFLSSPIAQVHTQPYFAPLYEDKAAHTENIDDVWKHALTPGMLQIVRTEAHIRSVLTYPLMVNGNCTGALIIGFNRQYEELTEFERDSLDSIVTVTSVALDRARLYQELTQSNEQQIVLIHFITHQLKGFVSKSRTIFSMMKEGDFGALPETMRPIVEEGFESDTKGIATIQEILNASNIKSGKVTYAEQSYDLRQLIGGVVHDLSQAATAKGLTLTYTPVPETAMIVGDAMQMTNAIKNLIDNSVKYTPSGSVTVVLEKDVAQYRITIRDTGVGITAEDMKHLFTEGGHGKDSHLTNVESTGFGLYIVKNIIEAQKGRVWAESAGVGQGARFIVEVPS